MRILFIFLSHQNPRDVVALARTLTDTATDARAVVHFDASAAPADFAALSRATAGLPRIALVRRRVRCVWGGFGLVEATFNALADAREAARAEGRGYDYAILLSGGCLPCRPVRQLERYLLENAGREFIEIADERWPVGGLRAERWEHWHPLPPTRFEWIERRLLEAQRLIGVKRRIPGGLTARLGSQWWALTWKTCEAMLDFASASPATVRFFRTVWIPDEMAIQTLVHHLVPSVAVAGFGLTHFQFTNWGKPVVFYDDHLDYALTVPRFFLRKVSPEAKALTERLLARAAEPDDGSSLKAIGSSCLAYAAKAAAQTEYPVPGQIFYRDQFNDFADTLLRRAEADYVVAFGPIEFGRAVLERLPEPTFTRFGALFDPGRVDVGADRTSFADLSCDDAPIRDLHPALYLVRARRRATGVPVLLWTPRCDPRLFEQVLRDPNALVVVWSPQARSTEAAVLLYLEAELGPSTPPPFTTPNPEAARRAWVPQWTQQGRISFPALDVALSAGLFSAECAELRGRVLRIGWSADEIVASARQRGAILAEDHGASAFADRPWFPTLVAALDDAAIPAGLPAA